MNTRTIRCGIGGVLVGAVVAAALVNLGHTTNAEASTTPTWHRIDKSDLFLHDLTSGPAVLVAAMKVGADGRITGDLGSLHELRLARSPQGVVAARSEAAVPLESEGEGKVFFNASSEPVMAYFEVADGVTELLLRSGEGVVIGAMSELLQTETQRGCKCVCSGVHPITGQTVEAAQYIPCHQVVVDYVPGTPCDCSTIEGDLCWFPPSVHADQNGTYRDCKGGWIPQNPGNGA